MTWTWHHKEIIVTATDLPQDIWNHILRDVQNACALTKVGTILNRLCLLTVSLHIVLNRWNSAFLVQICQQIFAPNGGYRVYYPSNLLRNSRNFENWGIFQSFSCEILGHVTCLDESRVSENIWWIIMEDIYRAAKRQLLLLNNCTQQQDM